jgi:hypothetical protein
MDIERFLVRREQIDEQGRERTLVQQTGDPLVSRAEATAAAPVREKDDGARVRRKAQVAIECDSSRLNRYVSLSNR